MPTRRNHTHIMMKPYACMMSLESFLNEYVKENLAKTCDLMGRGMMVRGFGKGGIDTGGKTVREIEDIVNDWIKSDIWKVPQCKDFRIEMTAIEIGYYRNWFRVEFKIFRDGVVKKKDAIGCLTGETEP